MEELLKKPQGTCLPTLLRHQSVQISTVDKESRTAEVNHVMISHPDMFLGDSLVIHGVLGPFSPLQPRMHHIPQSSLCQSDSNKTIIEEEEEEAVPDHCRSTQELHRSNNSSHTKSGLTVICFSVSLRSHETSHSCSTTYQQRSCFNA
ncbi:BnaA03g60480D [Brassica napus]|uniref:BnaA03g60480D protein n=1 Tax=Brassica napus TaxID=3708 RepID=A0A078H3U3_BRANA|nr:BnaA03g60480D [Brassica napus]